jgi:hypothetical protein
MTEQAAAATAQMPETFDAVLRSMVGKVVTFVNPESYEDAPVGYRLTTGFYKAKVIAVGQDYLSVATELVHKRGEKEKEPVRQYIPILQIKRVSVLKGERLLHI